MASLQTIRDKGGVIVAVVIGISLLAFILGDVLTSGGGFFSSNDEIARVNGTSISAQEYQRELAVLGEVYKSRGGQSAFGDRMGEMVSQEAFQNLLVRYGLEPELDAIGISVSASELTDLLVGQNPAPMIREFFSNPQTGVYDPAVVRNFVAGLESDPSGNMQLVWADIQDNVKEQAQVMKFKALVDRGAYVTTAQADFYASLGATTSTIRYISQSAGDMDQELVDITDAEIAAYYKANLARFDQDEQRTLNYVTFEVLPSEADYAAAAEHIEQLTADFTAATDARLYAEITSQQPYDTRYYKREELTQDLANYAFGPQTTEAYTPELIDAQYTIYRVADYKNLPDSVEFEYAILDVSMGAQADSLLTLMRRGGGSAFAEVAEDFTFHNTGNTHNGGSTGMIDPQSIPEELVLPVSDMNRGQISKIELPTGIFLVKLNAKKGVNRKVQLAKVVYDVDPSEQTRMATRQSAIEFASAAQTNGFGTTAANQGLFARTEVVYPYSNTMQAFNGSRDAVRWAFNNTPGALSDILEYGDTYVVATLSKATPEGKTPLGDVSEMISTILRNQALVAQAAKSLEGGNIDALAQSLGTEIMTETDVNFLSPSYSAAMYEPAVIGAVTALKEGQTSTPISGNQAAYLVEVTETSVTPQSTLMIKERIKAEQNQYLFQGAYQTLLENLKITDTRYRFF